MEKIDYKKELMLLFTTEKSLFSSKKIERTIVFFIFLIATIVYLAFNIKSLDALQFIEVIGIWLFYGGYNTAMNYRDKKISKANTVIKEKKSQYDLVEGNNNSDIPPMPVDKKP